MIRAHRDWYFVFGDNLERTGYGGQAREARGEPNAIGIATKRRPDNEPGSFFTDDDFILWGASERKTFTQIASLIKGGHVVVWPLDGIGTGLAKLDMRAPRIYSRVEEIVRQYEDWAIERLIQNEKGR